MTDAFTANVWTHKASEFRAGRLEQCAVIDGDRITLSADRTGVFISVPVDARQAVKWESIYWTAENAEEGSLEIRTRFAQTEEALETARWSAPYPASGASIRMQGSLPMTPMYAGARFMQYRIRLRPQQGVRPAVSEVTLTCRLVQPSGYWPGDTVTVSRSELEFRWLPVKGSAYYELEVARDQDFRTDARRFPNLSENFFTPSEGMAFAAGEVWWRVRAFDGTGKPSEWSAPRCVKVSEARNLEEYKPVAHPRLFLNKHSLEQVRTLIREEPAFRQAFELIKARADDSLDVKVPPEEEVASEPGQHGGFHKLSAKGARGALEPLAFVYLITGEERYAEAARRIMLDLVSYSRWLGRPFGDTQYFDPIWNGALETAGICKGVATAYDWVYDYLSEQDRARIRDGLVRLGIRPLIHDWADPDTYWQIPRHQLAAGNWWAVCNSGAGIAALAVLDEEPEAKRWVRLVEDAIRWFLAYRGGDVWNVDVRARAGGEYLAITEPNWGIDGGYVESIGYAHYGLLNAMYFIEALFTATGVQMSDAVRSDILDEPLYGLFHDSELGYRMVNFNDSGDGANLSPDIYALVAKHTRNPVVQWLLVQTYAAPSSVHSILAWDDSIKARSPEGLPKSKLFRDIGWVIFRTGWADKDSLFAAKFHQGRGHEDLGQFVIYHRGSQQVIDPGSIDYADPIYGTFLNQTKAHNVLMVDGERQWRLDGNVTAFLARKGIGLAVADLTDAYQHALNHWHRGMTFLEEGIYVVWDSVASEQPRDYSWLLHPHSDVEVSGLRVSMGNKNSRLVLHLMASAKVIVETLPGYIGKEEQPYLSFDIKKRKSAKFLGVFADGSFVAKRVGKTAVELRQGEEGVLVWMGTVPQDLKSRVSAFEGEFGAAVFQKSDLRKVLAHSCRKVETHGISVSSPVPVDLLVVKENGEYVIDTDSPERLEVETAPGTSFRIGRRDCAEQDQP